MRRLNEIERDAANATNGPWEVREDGHVYFVHGYGTVARDMSEWDAAFIANARTDVPDLVALVEWMRDAMVGYRAWVTSNAVKRATSAASIHGMGITEAEWKTQGRPAVEAFDAALAAAGGTDTQTARDDGQGGTP